MPKAKYYDEVRAAQSRQREEPASRNLDPFSLEELSEKGLFAKLKSALSQAILPIAYRFSRRFKPLMPLAGLLHVTREAQVREILERPEDFQVPFGPEMEELGDGAIFLLGLEGEEHDRLHRILSKVIRREDTELIGKMASEFTAALLENSSGKIDVIADLLKRVPSEICQRYFGLYVNDIDAFGDWSMALSALLFGDPYAKPKTRKLAMNAKRRLAAVIDDAIARTKRMPSLKGASIEDVSTLVERFVILQNQEQLSDKEIGAMLMGLVTGFIPTNTLASSNMLLELLKRPNAMALAKKAAREDDHETMHKIILEAGRLNPALAPGQWRYCPHDTTISIDGREKTISAGTTMLVSTMSALRDPRAVESPGDFRLDRTDENGNWQDPDLVFGIGPHHCLGKYLAIAQISALFSALLKQQNLKPVSGKPGKLKMAGPFPRHLEMHYESTAKHQSMFMIIAPVKAGITKAEADEKIGEFGNPSGAAIRAAFDETRLVHFSSLATVESEDRVDIVFELSTDGEVGEAVAAIAEKAESLLRPVFHMAGLNDDQPLLPFLQKHVVELHGKPWGATGLDYNGLREFPIRKVEKQKRFSDFSSRVLQNYVATETARGSHPTLVLAHLRKILRQDPILKAEATPRQLELMEEARREGYDAFHLMTQSMRLNLSTFRAKGHVGSFLRFMASKDGRIATIPLAGLFALSATLIWLAMAGSVAGKLLFVPFLAALAVLVIVVTIFGIYFMRIRAREKTDPVNDSDPPVSKLHDLVATEDAPGYSQNHVMAVSTLKGGWFRTFTHAFALWGIKMAIIYWYRPGLILGMGTIHYARWMRVPNSRTVIFYSNFDGSWENYLEDFITRASWGQTAAWSNWEKFPETRYLLYKGAQDGDEFKRWVRVVQQAAPFWYARFPELTADQIRTNGLIHAGAGLASNATEAEEWIRCFGSMPRLENRVETDEVQALVFRGMKRLPYSVSLAIKLPEDSVSLGEWLCWIRGRPMRIDGLLPAGSEGQMQTLVDQGILIAVPRPGDQPDEYALAHAHTITFGDRPLTGKGGSSADANAAMSQAVFLGISAAGMSKFKAPNMDDGALVGSFPNAFKMGMASRGRILGDADQNAPQNWRWNDNPESSDATEAVLMLYASDRQDLAQMAQLHRALLENHGGKEISVIDCAPVSDDPGRADFEHFGYRDGISQPVMKGTSRTVRGVPERDIVEPGEFLMGYVNDSDYMPSSPKLPQEADLAGALPVVIDDNLSRYTDFGDGSLSDAPRDLGRNGTFLVIRELQQDVDGFEAFTQDAADRLNQDGYSDLYKLVGQSPDKDWVKAKLMGRWPNGRPLIGNPIGRESNEQTRAAEIENDFTYGDDDPQGLACPFGSHVRRTNPRDSKNPGDAKEQGISNRHRLLRRGRPYTRDEGKEKGLLFASVCTDIERQFEFVQQLWANAPSFHGLIDEPDPIIGACPVCPTTGETKGRVFTIPTPAGPVKIEGLKNFVQVMGGGYFFMPSRSALGWLSDTALHARQETDEGTRS